MPIILLAWMSSDFAIKYSRILMINVFSWYVIHKVPSSDELKGCLSVDTLLKLLSNVTVTSVY